MSQHDLIIDNASGASVRADLNNALAALGSSMKGPNAPPAPIAGMIWVDDDTPSATVWAVKQYDGADWIDLGRLDITNNAYTPSEGVIAWADVASAATVDLGAQASRNLRITGTTTITSFGTAASGVRRELRFAAALTLTNSGTLILPSGANITTAAGDTATAVSLGSGNWIVTAFQRASGLVVAAGTMAVVKRGVAQSIPNVTNTAISWDNVEINDSSIYAAGSPTRLTVPVGVTRVRLTLSVLWGLSNTGVRIIYIRANSSTDIAYDFRLAASESGAMISRIIPVSAGDYFEAIVNHNAGAVMNIGGNNATVFSLEVLR